VGRGRLINVAIAPARGKRFCGTAEVRPNSLLFPVIPCSAGKIAALVCPPARNAADLEGKFPRPNREYPAA
jgi:hypothetical protein